MIKHIIFIALFVVSGYFFWMERTVTHGPGEVAPTPPTQHHAFGVKDFRHETFLIKPLAKFDIEARLLSKKWYYTGTLTEISPIDFLVGWGPMSDESVIGDLLITQSERYFSWQMTNQPIPLNKMVRQTSNIHIIPKNEPMREKLAEVLIGNVIHLKGYLVEARSNNGWSMKSSLTRNDYGQGASELMYVNELEIVK